MEPVLAFETSSPVLSIALSTAQGSWIEKTVKGYSSHDENLLPVTDRLLKKKKISIQKIGTLLIGRGPGSFTGLRIGFATLKGLLMAGKKNCYGALSLDLIAENITLPEGQMLCVCLDAHRDRIYSRLYKRVKGAWKALNKPAVLLSQEWLDQLPRKVTLAGNAVQRYRSQIDATCHPEPFVCHPERSEGSQGKLREESKILRFVQDDKGYPRASTLIRLFQNDPKKLQKLEKPADFLPLYFRLSEAEERRKVHAATC